MVEDSEPVKVVTFGGLSISVEFYRIGVYSIDPKKKNPERRTRTLGADFGT